MTKLVLISLVLCFGFSGCESTNREDLVGTWILTDASRSGLLPALEQNAAGRIILNANGTFLATEIPGDLLYNVTPEGNNLVTGGGFWQLVSREGGKQVRLVFDSITMGQRAKLPFETQLRVSRGRSAVTLFYFQGDADLGRRIDFKRVDTSR